MSTSFSYFYSSITILLTLFDFYIALLSFRREDRLGKKLGIVAAFGAGVVLFFLLSVFSHNYRIYSIVSSLYFLSIDVMLIAFVAFMADLTHVQMTPILKKGMIALVAYFVFEVVIFLVNPFYEIVLSYEAVPNDLQLVLCQYHMGVLYIIHLVYTYGMVAISLFMLIHRLVKAPIKYRIQYYIIITGVLVIVAANAIFLYFGGDAEFTKIDYSVWGYSLIIGVIYWSAFPYPNQVLARTLALDILDNVDQGIILFSSEGHRVLHNERLEKLLAMNMETSDQMESFVHAAGVESCLTPGQDMYSIQCYVQREEETIPLRCDYRKLKNRRGEMDGHLFVFTDAALSTDLLSGFQTYESFVRMTHEASRRFLPGTAVLVFDMARLAVFNSVHGKKEGDRMIRQLAEVMRRNNSHGEAFFVRGQEAHLIVLIPNAKEEECRHYAEQVVAECEAIVHYGIEILQEQENPLQAIAVAERSMQNKKMLDKDATHSQMLSSLMKALQECDSETEAHVRRTQKLGEALGLRIGLSDSQLSDLALLCLLHDIGKIGIPLELLNKPGKLNEKEWEVIQSHTEKGYQIAMSSEELRSIGEMIRHHHERWDGKGYPDGLSRETIPILSRVISVVDAYDAIVSDRPYKRKRTQEEAIEELRRCAGTQFDPHLIKEFIPILQSEMLSQHNLDQDPMEQEESSIPLSKDSREEIRVFEGAHPVYYSRYTLNQDDFIIEVDDRFEELTGYTREEVVERKLRQEELIPPEDRTAYFLLVNQQMLQSGTIAYLEHRLLHKNGTTRYVFCQGEKYYDSAAKEERVRVTISDTSQSYTMHLTVQKESERAVQRLEMWEKTYRQDALTGLLNHSAFQNDVDYQLLSGQKRVLFLMMDLDYFKEYNDTYGHSAGDEFLILVAQSLKASLQEGDLACRMGGDEFSAALFFDLDATDDEMIQRAQRVFNKISMIIKTVHDNDSLSMGVALSHDNNQSFRQLYQSSDRALYRAKEEGRSCYRVSRC